MADVITGTAIEGSTIYLLARINGGDGTAIQQADLTGIAAEVWQINPPPEEQRGNWQEKYLVTSPPVEYGSPLAPSVATVVFDSLQTDARWTADATGYNFRLALGPTTWETIPLADYPKGQWYRVDVKFDPAAVGETDFIASYLIEVQSSLFGKS